MPREPRTVAIHLLPPADGLPQDSQLAVIVDVLRASTTIVAALEAKAMAVLPCLTIEDARNAASERGALLGGERGGVKLDGFDFGNSPSEYTSQTVGGQLVAFTTTNGTRALLKSVNANEIVIGAFVNLSAIVARCSAGRSVDIVCAGTDGEISGEDVLFAGVLAQKLVDCGKFKPANDATQIAMDFSRTNAENPTHLLETVRQSQGGRNLIALGYNADIAFAANLDLCSVVPTYDAKSRLITTPESAAKPV